MSTALPGDGEQAFMSGDGDGCGEPVANVVSALSEHFEASRIAIEHELDEEIGLRKLNEVLHAAPTSIRITFKLHGCDVRVEDCGELVITST